MTPLASWALLACIALTIYLLLYAAPAATEEVTRTE